MAEAAAKPNSKRSGKPANKRGTARLAAVQALYQMDIGGMGVAEVVAEYENHRLGRDIDGETYRDADAGWFRSIVGGVVEEQRRIDPLIHANLPPSWPLARLDSTLRAVLRAGVWELMRKRDVDARVVVSEYVEVAKAFFDGDEPRVVNGVLDRLGRSIRVGELDPRDQASTDAAPSEPSSDGDAADKPTD